MSTSVPATRTGSNGESSLQAGTIRTDPASAREHAQRSLVLLAIIGHRMTEALTRELGGPELTGNVPVLVVCDLALRGPLRPRDLQDVTGLTSGGMTKVLDRLEELGLTERSFGRVPGDRRAIVVSLTPKGLEAARSIGDAIAGVLEELRPTLDDLAALAR
jgi:DNA-binding MarR family transcriptional regulator